MLGRNRHPYGPGGEKPSPTPRGAWLPAATSNINIDCAPTVEEKGSSRWPSTATVPVITGLPADAPLPEAMASDDLRRSIAARSRAKAIAWCGADGTTWPTRGWIHAPCSFDFEAGAVACPPGAGRRRRCAGGLGREMRGASPSATILRTIWWRARLRSSNRHLGVDGAEDPHSPSPARRHKNVARYQVDQRADF